MAIYIMIKAKTNKMIQTPSKGTKNSAWRGFYFDLFMHYFAFV